MNLDKKRIYESQYLAEGRRMRILNMTPAQRVRINDLCKGRGGTGTFMKKQIRDRTLGFKG